MQCSVSVPPDPEFPYQFHPPLQSSSPAHQDRCQGSEWSQSRSAPTGQCSPCWSWAVPHGWWGRRALPAVASRCLGFFPSPVLQNTSGNQTQPCHKAQCFPGKLSQTLLRVTSRSTNACHADTQHACAFQKAFLLDKIKSITKFLWNMIIIFHCYPTVFLFKKGKNKDIWPAVKEQNQHLLKTEQYPKSCNISAFKCKCIKRKCVGSCCRRGQSSWVNPQHPAPCLCCTGWHSMQPNTTIQKQEL